MISLSRRLRLLIPALGLVLFLAATSLAGDAVFQYSTIDALLAGLYEGDMTMAELARKGDFGLGTLNGIDGELVVLDGVGYHVSAGGAAVVAPGAAAIPFATVSFFGGDRTLDLGAIDSLAALNEAVAAGLPSKNVFWAIRIDGVFPSVKARAIPKQSPPYAPLAEVAKQQVIVTLSGEGTLVGYYSPPFVKGVNVPGFHWHFLTADRARGGHVLDCSLNPATALLDELRTLTVRLPASTEFDGLDLSGDKTGELHAVEKGPAKGE